MLRPTSAISTAALLLGVAGTALSAQSPTKLTSGPLTSAQAQADFDVLRSAIEEAHGGLYRHSTKASLDRRFDGHRARLSAPIARRDFIAVISEMVAELRDGHARVEYDDATTAALTNARLLPLRVQLEGNRLIVVSNDSPGDTTIRPGMEVTSINGYTVPEILAAILPKIPGDGFIETGKRCSSTRPMSFALPSVRRRAQPSPPR